MSGSDPGNLKNAPERGWQAHLPELVREAERDQILRVAHGVYIYPLLLVVLAATTRYTAEHPRIFWSCSAAILMSMLMRLALLPVRKHLDVIGHRRLRLMLVANIALASGGLGAIHFWMFWFMEWTTGRFRSPCCGWLGSLAAERSRLPRISG